jgi:hypothetical protein
VETIVRQVRKSKSQRFTALDTVHLEVTQIGDREWFSWPGGDRFENDPATLVGQGLVSSGEFLTHARTALTDSAEVVRFKTAEEVAGRPALRYAFRIPSAFSGFTVSDERSRDTVGESGVFWIDAANYELLQVSVAAENIPGTSDIAAVDSLVRYQYVDQDGGGRTLFPEQAETRMQFRSGRESRNTVQFAQCRRYQTESTMLSDATEARSAPPPEAAPLRTMPGGALLHMRLETPIHSGMPVGQPITAVLDEDVRVKGETPAPTGSKVVGRLRMLERYTGGGVDWAVSLEFNQIVAPNGRFRFMALLEQIGPLPGLVQQLTSTKRTMDVQTIVGRRQQYSFESTTIAPVPGVGSFFMHQPAFEVPAGTPMTWRTIAPQR